MKKNFTDNNPMRSGGTPHVSKVLWQVTGRAMKRRGFQDSRLIENWPAIVGEQLASMSQPVRLSRKDMRRPSPSGGPTGAGDQATNDGAVLTIRVEGAMALELQHLAPQIIDRLNGYYGHAAIGRLNIIQGPVGTTESPLAVQSPDEEEVERLAATYEEITHPRLKRALARLALFLKRDRR